MREISQRVGVEMPNIDALFRLARLARADLIRILGTAFARLALHPAAESHGAISDGLAVSGAFVAAHVPLLVRTIAVRDTLSNRVLAAHTQVEYALRKHLGFNARGNAIT